MLNTWMISNRLICTIDRKSFRSIKSLNHTPDRSRPIIFVLLNHFEVFLYFWYLNIIFFSLYNLFLLNAQIRICTLRIICFPYALIPDSVSSLMSFPACVVWCNPEIYRTEITQWVKFAYYFKRWIFFWLNLYFMFNRHFPSKISSLIIAIFL